MISNSMQFSNTTLPPIYNRHTTIIYIYINIIYDNGLCCTYISVFIYEYMYMLLYIFHILYMYVLQKVYMISIVVKLPKRQ